MKLYAIADLHLDHDQTLDLLERLPSFPDDWLIIAGDVSHTLENLQITLDHLTRRFARVIWVPGNHELWTTSTDADLRGEARYAALVRLCRDFGVLTPEDPYVTWPGEPRNHLLVPLFLLYDYSFRPDSISEDKAIDWAAESGVLCADEFYLHSDPYPSRAKWSAARCQQTAARLEQELAGHSTILINHWPLRRELAILPRIPRFSLWCGTCETEEWPARFRASVVVYGHLHIRNTQHIDGVRFEEVSVGYPRQYRPERGMHGYLREILPGTP